MAAIAHYKWTRGSTPVVLVVIGERRQQLFVTYNVRYGPIKDLGETENSVTIVTKDTSSGGAERTILEAKIDTTQTAAKVAGVSFQVCGFVDSVHRQSPAQIVIGISRLGNGCNEELFTGPLDTPLL
jgi:hypothetical protein